MKENKLGNMVNENPTNGYYNILEKQPDEVRKMILSGIDQIKEGKTKDFDEVCDRLEKKYKDSSNWWNDPRDFVENPKSKNGELMYEFYRSNRCYVGSDA